MRGARNIMGVLGILGIGVSGCGSGFKGGGVKGDRGLGFRF